MKGPDVLHARRLLKSLVEDIEEHFDPAKTIAGHLSDERLGLANAAIAMAAST